MGVMRWFVLLALCFGCGAEEPPPAMEPETPEVPVEVGVPFLGAGMHTPDAVDISVLATGDDALNLPRDLEFEPDKPDQLWVVNLAGSSMVILTDVGTPQQDWMKRNAAGNAHFLARPSAIAFGAPGTFATAQEEDDITQPSTPPDFMGPTLWSSDLDIFDGGHEGHLDMLHNSPNSVGIAWDHDNIYWVVDGMHGSLTRYDFRDDHGPGGTDHSDGIIDRYADGMLGYVADVPSHAEMEHETGLLYVADTGNNRIVMLDTHTGEAGGNLTPNYDGVDMRMMNNAMLMTFVEGADHSLEMPSGLALHDDMVIVGDHATSRIVAFDMEGSEVDHLDLSSVIPAMSMMGLTVGPDGALYVIDSPGHIIYRVAAL